MNRYASLIYTKTKPHFFPIVGLRFFFVFFFRIQELRNPINIYIFSCDSASGSHNGPCSEINSDHYFKFTDHFNPKLFTRTFLRVLSHINVKIMLR